MTRFVTDDMDELHERRRYNDNLYDIILIELTSIVVADD